jgi:hypothetical protein
VCVLVVRAFEAVLLLGGGGGGGGGGGQLGLGLGQIMDLAYRGEMNTLSRCGRMVRGVMLWGVYHAYITCVCACACVCVCVCWRCSSGRVQDQCVAMHAGSVALMSFDSAQPAGDAQCVLTPVACREPLFFVVADLNAAKDTVELVGSIT